MKSIGIVGCGAIGRALITAVASGKLAVRIAGVTSRTEKSARDFLAAFPSPPRYLSLSELIAAADLIVEAAGGSVVQPLSERVFAAGKDLMVISVGALLDHPEILKKSRQSGCRLYVPSGAIAGLDGIKRELPAPEASEENVYLLDQRRQSKLGLLPQSLDAALEALEEDDVVREALGQHVYERFVSAKRQEWEDYRMEVTAWELNKYLNIY